MTLYFATSIFRCYSTLMDKIITSSKPNHICDRQTLKMATFNIVFHTGGQYEDRLVDSTGKRIIKGNRGWHHLLEHLSCSLYNDMLTELKEKGISENAATSNDMIIFSFRGLDSYLTPELKLRLFERLTGKYTITDERFQNEKNTILDEYCDTFNSPISGTLSNFYRKRFNSACAIGLKDDLLNVTNDDIRKMHD